MKSWRIHHFPPEDHSENDYKSHTSDDREQQLEKQKTGYEPPAWVDITRQVLTPLAFIAQLVTSDLNTITRTGEGISGAFSQDSDAATAFEPSPAWFCIWAFIYAGLAFFTVYQAVPEQRASILCRSIGWEVVAGLILQSAWGGVASMAKNAAVPLVQLELEALMLCLFLLLTRAMWVLSNFERKMTSFDQALVVFPITIWAGWITQAFLLNTAALVRVSGAKSIAYTDPNQLVCIVYVIVAAALSGCLIVAFKGCPWYTLAILWGFLATAVTSSRPGARYIAAAAGVAFTAIFLTGYWTLWTSSEHTRWGAVSRRFHQLRMVWDGLSTDPKQEGSSLAKGLRSEGSGGHYGATDQSSAPGAGGGEQQPGAHYGGGGGDHQNGAGGSSGGGDAAAPLAAGGSGSSYQNDVEHGSRPKEA